MTALRLTRRAGRLARGVGRQGRELGVPGFPVPERHVRLAGWPGTAESGGATVTRLGEIAPQPLARARTVHPVRSPDFGARQAEGIPGRPLLVVTAPGASLATDGGAVVSGRGRARLRHAVGRPALRTLRVQLAPAAPRPPCSTAPARRSSRSGRSGWPNVRRRSRTGPGSSHARTTSSSSSRRSPRTTCRSRCARSACSATGCGTRFGDDLPEEAAGDLERMQSAAERMQRLINDLLELLACHAGGSEFEPVDLGCRRRGRSSPTSRRASSELDAQCRTGRACR